MAQIWDSEKRNCAENAENYLVYFVNRHTFASADREKDQKSKAKTRAEEVHTAAFLFQDLVYKINLYSINFPHIII